jgi:hypothetical protein
MSYRITLATGIAALAAIVLTADCSSPGTSANAASKSGRKTKSITAVALMEKLAAAGLETRDIGPASISVDHASRFPETPRSTLALRVSDGQGNSETMTFVEFSSWKAAAALDDKPVNGFVVRNWFVLGIVSTYFVDKITNAVG